MKPISERFRAFLFDLDGVVYLGDRPLPRARESLVRLRGAGRAVRFLTNDPRPTREEVALRLSGLGVEADPEEVVTSGWATAEYLHESGARSAYVVGSEGLASEVRSAGVEVPEDGAPKGVPDAVVVGCDENVSYTHIRAAAGFIHRGARFVATNADGSFPTPQGPSPATGAILAAVRAVVGGRPVIVGKPHPAMFEMILENLDAGPEETVVVGDSPETDVLGAHRAGMAAVLVSEEGPDGTGVSADDPRAPDAVIPDLSGLFEPTMVTRQDPSLYRGGSA